MSDISGISGSSSSLYSTGVNNTYATVQNAQSLANNPFANLDLTTAQQTQIQQIFQNAQSQGLTPAQVQSQINAVLTPAQQTQLQQNLKSEGHHHHHHHGGSDAGSSTQNDTDAWGIPLSTGSITSATQSLSDVASQFALQLQLQNNNNGTNIIQ